MSQSWPGVLAACSWRMRLFHLSVAALVVLAPSLQAQQYELSVSTVGAGHTDLTNGWYPTGTVVAVTAYPQPGNRFVGWSGTLPDGVTTQNPANLTMSQAWRPVATFALRTFSGAGAGTAGDPYQIANVEQLQEMNLALGACYVLVTNIDASATTNWNDGAGFEPVGAFYQLFNGPGGFQGSLDGQGHAINGLFINRPTVTNNTGIGLFGFALHATVQNLGLVNVDITADNTVGALAGVFSDYGQYGTRVRQVFATGAVRGRSSVAGLVGGLYDCTVADCYSSVDVFSTSDNAGGLIMWMCFSRLYRCYATGRVEVGSDNAGGLLSGMQGSSIPCYVGDSFATGKVQCPGSQVGGLLGYAIGAPNVSFINSYYTDSDHQNGYGTFESSGPDAFRGRQHTVYQNWDFTNVWREVANSCPVFQWEEWTPPPATDPLVFTPASPQVYGTTNALAASGGSGTGTVSFVVLSGPGLIVGITNLTVTNGTGSIWVRATKAEDSLYHSGSVTSLVMAAKAAQTISFVPIPMQVSTGHVGLSAVASSGLGVSFVVRGGPASIAGGTNLSFSSTGVVSIVASQAGDGNFTAAPDETNTFAVVMPTLAVSPNTRTVGAAAGATTFTVANTGGGSMAYTTGESESWLSITGGGTGGNSGTIAVAYNANLVPNTRTGIITVAASGATGSPRTVTVKQVGHGPDFVVSALQMTPPDPATGRTFTVKATLLNQGTLSGNAGYVSLWVNHPAVAVVNESTPKRSSVGTLTPGQSRIITFTALVAPVQAGTYTLRAFVDSAGRTAEGDESNNQTTLAYQARSAYVDLEVVDIDVAPIWPLPLGSLATYVTLQNRGNVASPATRLSVWSNQADEVSCGALGLYKTVTALSPWTPRRETVTGVRAPNAAGDYVLRAFVDSTCALAETTETNNQGTLQYTVYNPTPNLTVTKIALSVSRPRGGQTFVATVTVKNIGTGSAAAGRVGVWLNRVTAPGVGDTPDAYIDTVSLLAPGASTSLKVAGLLAPAAGARTIFALVDANGAVAELSEIDNALSMPYTVLP